MIKVEKARVPRLFIVEFELAELSSHYFNQVLGFKLAAEDLGWEACVLLPKDVAPSLAEPLRGHRVIEFDPASAESPDYWLDSLAESDPQLRSLWAFMEHMAVSRDDIVLITSGRPVVIYSLGAWLGRLAPENRPAVFVRFYGHDYLDMETMDYTEQSWMYRFASRDLALRPGQERIFFTANNEKLIAPLGQLCVRRIFQMPLPKYYGAGRDDTGGTVGAPVIYAHVNVRSGVMLNQIQSVIRGISDTHPDVRFLLKYCRDALSAGADGTLHPDLIGRGVELIPSEQSHPDHLRTIARSHIVLLPYEVTAYAGLASGVFAEGAALGKVVVYPANSWMDDQVAGGHAAGVGFAVTSETDISAAIVRALDSLPDRLEDARVRSATFRDQHSCRRNLDVMRRLASEPHDMRLTYIPGTEINFRKRFQSRGYMGRGWSKTETHGVWTDGAVAELLFRIEQKHVGPLDARVRLTPFLAEGHPQRIVISVNDVELCEWIFSDHDERGTVWRTLAIPAYDEIRMLVHVKNPVSPRQLGMSDDPRLLGAMFHEMSLDQATTSASAPGLVGKA